MTDRRPARNQPLPFEESAILRVLKDQDLYNRCAELYAVGWTLRAIGDQLHPPRSRSTVRSWVSRADSHTSYPDPETPEFRTPSEYVPKRPPSPGISTPDRATIASLAPTARNYRARLASDHPATIANTNLTTLVRRLHEDDVTVRELADAAGVTYRAMARRLGKSK